MLLILVISYMKCVLHKTIGAEESGRWWHNHRVLKV